MYKEVFYLKLVILANVLRVNRLKKVRRIKISMKNLIFKNVIVEMLVIEGIPYFNPYHVGMCLGLSDSTIRDHVAGMNEKQVKKLKNSDVDNSDIRRLNNAGENFLTEAGLYKLIFKSNREQAEQFQDWVTDEVLPQIRQTGSYLSPMERLRLDLFSDDKTVVVQAHKRLLALETTPLLEQIEEQAPKVAFADAIAGSNTLIYISDLAKLLAQNGIDTGPNRLFDYLRDNGYLIKRYGETRNLPTQRSIELGILQLVETLGSKPNGEKVIRRKSMVTPKGQVYFLNKFLKEGK
ncbi:phage antirepressor Ant [Turicibacter sp. TS3]|nr:phage antirepressor Ant [Turicibacter sp. TS3]